MPDERVRYALVGVGSRGLNMFALPLANELADVADLVALCDANGHRLDLAKDRLGICLPTYLAFDHLLRTAQPQVVIVATVDATHHRYIIGALEAGCDVITEKPMATTAAHARAILEAERRTGRTVRVSFNARYGAESEALYRLLHQGVIGKVLSADFVEFLNTAHGADYFRRWHRRKANSGGLLLHKASHHFDQLNWWLGVAPQEVFAMGRLGFYGPTRAARGERCLTCPHAERCEFRLDLTADANLTALYLEAEQEDHYYRDRCVFSEEIDIEDTLALVIRYANGAIVNYSLNAYLPLEGQRIGFNGTEGRIEVDVVDQYHGPDSEGRVRVYQRGTPPVVHVYPRLGVPYDVPIETRADEGHGGADARIRAHLFRPETPDPLNQRAGALAGALAVYIGAAANRAMAEGRPVAIAEA
jgi:predicted dehydrogenase